MDLYNIRQKLNMGIPLNSLELRVTFYARVSTDHRDQQNSLENQKSFFLDLIKNNSHWHYIPGYIDEGISGTSIQKRHSFLRMIDDAQNNQFDLIITKEISRFSRNTLDSIKYTRMLLSCGVAVFFINDNINTALSDSELRLTIMASMAQDEIRRLSERVKFGMNQAINKGVVLGNDMLYGYQKDHQTGNLVIVDHEAKIVQKIFSLYGINHFSINRIVNLLNDGGYRTRQNKKWCISTISRMLRNPKYKGYYCGNKSEIIDYMTKKVKIKKREEWLMYKDIDRISPIIEEDLWNMVNQRLVNNKSVKQHCSYLLSHKIYCGNDGYVFHRRQNCQSSKEISWFCSNYLKNGKCNCDSPNLRESEIITIILDLINILEIRKNDVQIILKEYYQDSKVYIDDQLFMDDYISVLISKMIVKKNQDIINLDIYINLINDKKIEDGEYFFQRGYNTCCTRRYSVKYLVGWHFAKK